MSSEDSSDQRRCQGIKFLYDLSFFLVSLLNPSDSHRQNSLTNLIDAWKKVFTTTHSKDIDRFMHLLLSRLYFYLMDSLD